MHCTCPVTCPRHRIWPIHPVSKFLSSQGTGVTCWLRARLTTNTETMVAMHTMYRLLLQNSTVIESLQCEKVARQITAVVLSDVTCRLVYLPTFRSTSLPVPSGLPQNALRMQTASSFETSINAYLNLQAPCVLYIGQAFRCSPENALYIFNQQINFII